LPKYPNPLNVDPFADDCASNPTSVLVCEVGAMNLVNQGPALLRHGYVSVNGS
jgi:hypothetical protein